MTNGLPQKGIKLLLEVLGEKATLPSLAFSSRSHVKRCAMGGIEPKYKENRIEKVQSMESVRFKGFAFLA